MRENVYICNLGSTILEHTSTIILEFSSTCRLCSLDIHLRGINVLCSCTLNAVGLYFQCPNMIYYKVGFTNVHVQIHISTPAYLQMCSYL